MYEREKRIYDWHISTKAEEIIVFEGDDMGRCLIVDRMRIAARVLFVDGLVKVNTSEGYFVQIDPDEKHIQVMKE